MTYDKPITLGPCAKDISGKTFGRLKVIFPVERNRFRTIEWLCICECGNETVVNGIHLRSKQTMSCGCLKRDSVISSATTHGLSQHPLHRIWIGMRSRCYNPNKDGYSGYGGRGITVCKEWDDFGVFLTDMGERPSSKHSIDRIDNDGDYTPKNCRWATPRQQSNNMRTNRLITYSGETLTMAQWCRRVNISTDAMYGRLKRGWSVDRALTEKTMTRSNAK